MSEIIFTSLNDVADENLEELATLLMSSTLYTMVMRADVLVSEAHTHACYHARLFASPRPLKEQIGDQILSHQGL